MKKKLFMLLALLTTAVTGAWAESKQIGVGVEYQVGDIITNSTGTVYINIKWEGGNDYGIAVNANQPVNIRQFSLSGSTLDIKLRSENGYAKINLSTGQQDGTYYVNNITCAGEFTEVPTVVRVASGDGTLGNPFVFGSDDGGGDVDGFSLTKAKDAEAHGTVKFMVDEKVVTKAEVGDLVTVEITPTDDDYVIDDATGEWYAAIAKARGQRRVVAETEDIDLLQEIELEFVSEDEESGVQIWTFEMIAANAEISVSYNDLEAVIGRLRPATERAQVLFRAFGDILSEEDQDKMFDTVGDAILLLRDYDAGEEVDIKVARKLYLQLKKFIAMFDDIVTGINNVNLNGNVNGNGNWYDMSGRRVNGNVKKGIYIQNGRKIVVK